MKDDILYLIHIRECIEKIKSYVAGVDHPHFMSSPLLQDAVLRNLQVLAESTQKLSEDYKGKYPEIEWHKIAGLRNILVHDYLGIDMETVWRIVDSELSALYEAMNP